MSERGYTFRDLAEKAGGVSGEQLDALEREWWSWLDNSAEAAGDPVTAGESFVAGWIARNRFKSKGQA